MGFQGCSLQDNEQNKKTKQLPYACCWCFINFLMVGLYLTVVIVAKRKLYNKLRDEGNPGEIETVFQLVEDWQTRPFVDLQVVEGDSCPEMTDPVFSREWKGTEVGCLHQDGWECERKLTAVREESSPNVRNLRGGSTGSSGGGYSDDDDDGCQGIIEFGEGFVETYRDYSIYVNYNQTNPNFREREQFLVDTDLKKRSTHWWDGGCPQKVYPLAPVMQTSIHGTSICGTRGGDPFITVMRPDLETGECPQGTTPCSEATSADNTVCYPPASHETLCPITDIFIADGEYGESLKNNTSYTVIDYHDDEFSNKRFMVYSKNLTDNLPIMRTAIDKHPCMNPSQISNSDHYSFYPTELSRGKYCEASGGAGAQFDPRYIQLNDSISEFDLQLESGVIELLQRQPYHERHVDYGLREVEMLSLWIRPTIPWQRTRQCTGPGLQTVVEDVASLHELMNMQQSREFHRGLLTTMWMGIVLIVLSLIAAFFMFVTTDKAGIQICFGACSLFVFTCFFLPMYLFTHSQSLYIVDMESDLQQSARFVNGCSDEYTAINLSFNNGEISYYKTRIGALQTITDIIGIAYIALLGGLLLLTVALMFSSEVRDDGNKPVTKERDVEMEIIEGKGNFV